MGQDEDVARGEVEFMSVKSMMPTVPYPPWADRDAIFTERLMLRTYQESDLQAIFELRSDPRVAAWTPTGKPQTDIETTRKAMEPMLANTKDRYDFVICLASSGHVIGMGGQHNRCGALGWPEMGYSLKADFWGQGYGTEFLQGFLQWYWAVPRTEIELQVDKTTIADKDAAAAGALVPDCMVAMTVAANKASLNVMAKSGMKLVRKLPVTDLRDENSKIDLLYHAVHHPEEENGLD